MATTTIVTFKTVQTSYKVRQGEWAKSSSGPNSKTKNTEKVNETEVRQWIKNLILNEINEYDQDGISVYTINGTDIQITDSEYGYTHWNCRLKNGNLTTCDKHTFDGRHTSVWQTICFFKGYQQKLDIDQMLIEVVGEILAERKKSVA